MQLLHDGDRPLALLLDDVGVSGAISECTPRPLSIHMAALVADMQQRCAVGPMSMFLCLQRPGHFVNRMHAATQYGWKNRSLFLAIVPLSMSTTAG